MQKTAIIYFSRLPGEEIRHKTFADRSMRLNKLIAARLFDHTASIIKKTGLPYFYYSEKYQHGKNFGERISNAMAEVFGQGYDAVIVVGSDTPNLDAKLLHNTHKLLSDNSLVVGPTQLGGCYLLGIQKNIFDKKTIASLPWQTSELKAALSFYSSNVVVLASLNEINNAAQLYLFTKTKIKTQEFIASFIQLILSWIDNIRKSIMTQPVLAVACISTTSGRAP